MAKVLGMYAIKKLVPGVGVTIALTMLFAGQLSAQPPLGAGDEVWVDVADTFCVGQEVEFQVYMANAADMGAFATTFEIYSPDSAQWDWVRQSNEEWNFQGEVNIITHVEGFRLWDYFPYRLGEWGPADSQSARFEVSATALAGPDAPGGPLEHAYTIHIRPSMAGTICIDSSKLPIGDDQWIYYPSGQHPAWNGPFCFTVTEPPIGDINCDGAGNVADAVYIINWIFKDGPEPCR